MKNSLKKVTDFKLLLFTDFNKVTFCKITSLLEGDVKKLGIFELEGDFNCVLDFIEKKKSSLKEISFPLWYINDHHLKSLSFIKGLDLTTVDLSYCTEITDFGLSKLCESQKNIMELDISSSELTDVAVFVIVKCLPKIKSLRMQNCTNITDVSPSLYNITFIVIEYILLIYILNQ